MQKTIKQLPKSEVEATITVPWERVQKVYINTLNKIGDQIVIAGFRPGRAPLGLVEEKVSKGKVWRETLDTLLMQTLLEVLQAETLRVIDYPRYNVTQYGEEKDLVYTATMTVAPTVKIKDYRKIKVKKHTPKEVLEKDVREAIAQLFSRWQEERKRKGLPLVTKQREEPKEPDDVFAKALGAKDLVDLTAKVHSQLQKQSQFESEKEYEDKLLEEVLKQTHVDVPELLITEELNRMVVRLNQTLTQLGSTFEAFLKSRNRTVESLRYEWRPQAERNVRVELALAEIGKQEEIKIEQKEAEEQLKDHKTHEGHDHEKELALVTHALRQAKTLAWLKQHAEK